MFWSLAIWGRLRRERRALHRRILEIERERAALEGRLQCYRRMALDLDEPLDRAAVELRGSKPKHDTGSEPDRTPRRPPTPVTTE